MNKPTPVNQYEQPIGTALPGWQPRPQAQKVTMTGHFCRLEPLSLAHSPALFAAWHRIDDGRDWTYFSRPRPENQQQCDALVAANAASRDPLHFAVIDRATDLAVGSVALMRIDAGSGVLEIGWVNWSPLMKRSVLGTEAIYLLLGYTFDTLGYRRCEWKCHSLNMASNQAAKRLGFQYEGTFRQAVVVKGHNRDTCWYSIIDSEWAALARGLRGWLAQGNFDLKGQQRRPLAVFMQQSIAKS
ncbi:GNAT family protein [Acerihabitans sp. TG2]|uniref:GNAT family N-acetyltransferase n=1 Tax=Acerihabitans sp. TG2 TaxID=3096008 RepID=UPI002B22A775|nr:GNAT family protein [Acerihabitans sp. TG2]MEA9392526.1 GNAT family protein [Acerihabitans sp. TG2]